MYVSIFYDPQDFPQAQHYAECFGVFAEDLRHRMRLKAIKPTNHELTKIYFAVKDREAFRPIIESHSQFNCEFVDTIPDYRKTPWDKKMDQLRDAGFIEVFSDVTAKKKKQSQAAAIKAGEKVGKFEDPAKGEQLDTKVFAGLPALTRKRK